MISNPINLALTALLLPFRRPLTFLRCAGLPFLIWLALAGIAAIIGLAFPKPDGATEIQLPAFVQALFLLMFGFALFSLTSFTINWRRSLALSEAAIGATPLLNIDSRSIAYILSGFASSDSKKVRRHPGPVKAVLRFVGKLLLIAVAMVTLLAIVLSGLLTLRPDASEINVAKAAIWSGFFIFSFFGLREWEMRMTVALDLVPGSAPEVSKPVLMVVSMILGSLTTLLFFLLAIVLPLDFDLSASVFLPASAIWIGSLFLTIGWFAAAESMLLVAGTSIQPLHSGPTRVEAGS